MSESRSACSALWDDQQNPAWGTSATADLVVALEQNGPWGRVAATESHLEPGLGSQLDSLVTDLGGRLLLIRRPGRHADGSATDSPRRPGGRHRCYLARTGPDGWLVFAELADPGDLLSLTAADLTGPAALAARLGGRIESGPLLLVCTNGRRDACCAVRGRPVVGRFADDERVWEASHLGGHRFAPTGVLLPWGRMLARLDVDLVRAVLGAAQRGTLAEAVLGARHDRGPMHLPPAEQAAEAWTRSQEGRTDLTDPVTDAAGRATVTITDGPDLPESCGKAPVATRSYHVSWRATDTGDHP